MAMRLQQCVRRESSGCTRAVGEYATEARHNPKLREGKSSTRNG